MLHQLLFALIGKSGNIIKLIGDQFKMDPSLQILPEAEKQLINGMCLIGYHFKKIEQFIEQTCSSWTLPRNNNEQELQNNKSAYRKSFCYGLNEVMSEYKSLILGIQKNYLENRFFTYANIQAQLNKYFILFPELTNLIRKIQQQDIKGGMILDLISLKINSTNMWVREAYDILFKQCYKVLYNQISGWILYGKLLDIYSQFFIHKIESVNNSTQKQKDWDSVFTLQMAMIPNLILSKQTAEKILFIGKSIRILRIINKQLSLLPNQNLVKQVKELQNYESFKFDSIIQQIRYHVAQDLMELIMKKQNLMKQLQMLKNYYLMSKGEFFHIFLQESQGILSMPHNKKSEQYLNSIYLPNTLIRMRQENNNKLAFQLKQNGFTFKNFSTLSNLNVIGNVSLKPNNFLRFQPVKNFGGSLWYNMKQNIENGFTIRFSFRFKKLQYGAISLNATQMTQKLRSDISTTSICYVFQNINQISSWKKDAPINIQDMKQYICIKIGMIQTTKRSESRSFMSAHFYDSKKLKAQETLGEVIFNKKINFAEEDFHQLKIQYTNDLLKIVVDDYESNQNAIGIPIKIGKFLNLDMGKSFMGFLQNSLNSSYAVDIISWEMVGTNIYNSSDYWGDLTLHYEIGWPLSLILSNQLLQKYKQIFKLFFPIRQIQIDLDKLWVKLSRKMKFSHKLDEYLIRKISIFRSQLSLFINNLWSFFQSDVVQTQWCKLIQNLKKTDDFQKMRTYLDYYIKSISNMCFLTSPKILKSMFEIVKYSKQYLMFCHRIQSQDSLESFAFQFNQIMKQYKEAFNGFYHQLNTLSKTTNSNHLYQLLLRLDYNEYYYEKKFA